MIGYAEALETVRQHSTPLPTDSVALDAARGRVLARALIAPESLPPFDNTAMDGYALQVPASGLPAGARLPRVGELAAGKAPGVHAAGALEIMTGAPIPPSFNAVIPVEQIRLEDGDRLIVTEQAVSPGQHIRAAGQDIAAGAPLLEAGRVLDAAALALCAALGVNSLPVARRPRVALINTGNEVVDPATERLQPGQIRDSNGPYLRERLRDAGADCVLHVRTGDDPEAWIAAIHRAESARADIVVTTGAVSMGKYDFIPDTLRNIGALTHFHKVRMRPGKPILFARLATGALCFGLPGNPASCAVGLRFFVEPAIRRMLGMADEQALRLPLRHSHDNPSGLTLFLKGRWGFDGEGRAFADVLPGQESFRLRPLLLSNAWLQRPGEPTTLPAGHAVAVFPLGHLDATGCLPRSAEHAA